MSFIDKNWFSIFEVIIDCEELEFFSSTFMYLKTENIKRLILDKLS